MSALLLLRQAVQSSSRISTSQRTQTETPSTVRSAQSSIVSSAPFYTLLFTHLVQCRIVISIAARQRALIALSWRIASTTRLMIPFARSVPSLTGSIMSLTVRRSAPPNTIFNRVAYVSIADPSCPPGSTLKNSVCVATGPPSCSPGLIFDRKSCAGIDLLSCLSDTRFVEDIYISEKDPLCPPPLVFQSNICAYLSPLSCLSSTTFNRKVCISETLPSCEFGVFDRNICKDSRAPSCPPGTSMQNRLYIA